MHIKPYAYSCAMNNRKVSRVFRQQGGDMFMGVDHGRGRGGKVHPPRIWSRGYASANCPPQIFVIYVYRKERSVAFKIRQNPFSAGALPRTPLGSSRHSPRPPSRLERGHPSPYPTPFGTDPPSALAMRPPHNSSHIYAYGHVLFSVPGGGDKI